MSDKFKNSKINICFSDGNQYQGECKSGKRSGKGIEIYSNGNKYIGEFYDDRRHGHGTCIYFDKSIYEGEWKEGKRHGKGTESDSNGDLYIGEFKDGKKCGKGIFVFSNGKSVTGEWGHIVLSQEEVDKLLESIEENAIEVEYELKKIFENQIDSLPIQPLNFNEEQENINVEDEEELDAFFQDLSPIADL